MFKICTWMSLLLAVLFMALAAQADIIIYPNGGFEADAALVPNPGDTAAVIPTGWHYDDYYGYGVEPMLMNVSAIGNGWDGDVGVRFPNWNVEGGWDACITRFEQPVLRHARYSFVVAFTGENLIGDGNWLTSELWWTSDPADPWGEGKYGLLVGETVELTEADNGRWQEIAMGFMTRPGDPAVGNYFVPWVHAQNYDGNIIVGEATLYPEPTTIWLLVTGVIGLCLYRRKFA